MLKCFRHLRADVCLKRKETKGKETESETGEIIFYQSDIKNNS